jgi:adenylate kinase family enzyme
VERVLIIGPSGAGKSTLARKLAEKTGLPLIHLDQLHWRPGWVEPNKEDWKRTVSELVERPGWIMDGNYGGTLPMRTAAADTVIFLDFPTWICLSRVLLRIVSWWGRTREDMASGCPERLDFVFLRWIWR